MIVFLYFLIIFFIYLINISPTINIGDSSELATAGITLGIAHPPGYPLFTLLEKIFVEMIPYGNPVYKTNLFSATCACLAATLIFYVVYILTEKTKIIKILFASLCGFLYLLAPIILKTSLTTEVFALNAIFGVLIYFLILKNAQNISILLFYIFFLGVGNQHTLLFLFPSILFYLAFQKNLFLFFKKNIISIILLSAISLLIYIYLYIRSHSEPLLDWEDPQTLKRFIGVVLRKRYGTFQIAQGGRGIFNIDFSLFFTHFYNFFKLLEENLPVVFLFSIFFIFIKKYFQFKKITAIVLGIFFSGPFFLWFANINLTENTKELLERFLVLPYSITILLIGLSLGIIFSYIKNLFFSIFILILLFYFVPFKNILIFSHRNNFFSYDYVKNFLKNIPRNSLLFSDRADEVEFFLSNYLYTTKNRSDITFIDCNASVTKSIYGDDYYFIWGKPRLEIRTKVEAEIIKTNRDVFYATLDPNMINIERKNYGLIFSANNFHKPFIPFYDFFTLRFNKNFISKREKNLALSFYQLLSDYYFLNNKITEGKKIYEQIKVFGNKNIDFLIGHKFHSKNLLDEAERYYLKHLKKNPDDVEVLINLGIVKEQKNKLEEAINIYKKAIILDPYNVNSHYNLGVIYWKLNNWSEVVKEFEIVLKLQPNHTLAKRYLFIAKEKVRKNY